MSSEGVGLVTPVTRASMDIDSATLRHAFAAEIEMESVLWSPFFGAKDLIAPLSVGSKDKLPESSIVLDVTPSGKDGKAARDCTMEFIRSLDDAGAVGTASNVLGGEETIRTKFCKFYANDYGHGVAGQNYGIDYREWTPTQIFEKSKQLLAQWNGERNDYYSHEALCETRSVNLAATPLSLAQPCNQNTYVVGASTVQPSYSTTEATYEHNVGSKLTSTTYGNIHFSVANLLALCDYMEKKYIKPVSINGREVWVMLTCADEVTRLLDPATSGSWGAYWTTTAALSDMDKVIPGTVGMIADKLIIVRDPRAPTCVVGGNASAYTLSFGYVKQGRNDTRTATATANVDFNCNLLLGNNALARYENEAMHYEDQSDEYNKFENVGIFGSDGYQIPSFDVDTASTDAQQESSFLVFTQAT